MREFLTQSNYLRTLSGQCRVCPHKDPVITSSIYYSNKWTFSDPSFICLHLVRTELNIFNKCVSLRSFSKWNPKNRQKANTGTTKKFLFCYFRRFVVLTAKAHAARNRLGLQVWSINKENLCSTHSNQCAVINGWKKTLLRSLYPVNLWLRLKGWMKSWCKQSEATVAELRCRQMS